MNNKLSYDYIKGVIESRGSFTFHTVGYGSLKNKSKIPAFVIGMNSNNKDLLILIKETLGLRNKIYEYEPRIRKDGYKRQGTVMLSIRDIGQLKNVIVPLLYKNLKGRKRLQFEEWINQIGDDPLVLKGFKFIHKIYKSGFYDRNPKF